jgi:hypothetical protein
VTAGPIHLANVRSEGSQRTGRCRRWHRRAGRMAGPLPSPLRGRVRSLEVTSGSSRRSRCELTVRCLRGARTTRPAIRDHLRSRAELHHRAVPSRLRRLVVITLAGRLLRIDGPQRHGSHGPFGRPRASLEGPAAQVLGVRASDDLRASREPLRAAVMVVRALWGERGPAGGPHPPAQSRWCDRGREWPGAVSSTQQAEVGTRALELAARPTGASPRGLLPDWRASGCSASPAYCSRDRERLTIAGGLEPSPNPRLSASLRRSGGDRRVLLTRRWGKTAVSVSLRDHRP